MKGQTLIELLVALGIAALAIIAVVALATTSLSNITFSRLQGESNRHARTAIEWLRGERDKDWATFVSKTGTWCLPSLSWPSSPGSCTPGNIIPGTQVLREVTLAAASSTEINLTVRVYWTDSKGLHETRLNSKLTRWR